MELISGVEAELSTRSYALTLQVVADQAAELAVYRRWWGERRVDGVLVCDLRVDDPRIHVLEELALPTVVLGAAAGSRSLATSGPTMPRRSSKRSSTLRHSVIDGSRASAGSPSCCTPPSAPTRLPRRASGWASRPPSPSPPTTPAKRRAGDPAVAELSRPAHRDHLRQRHDGCRGPRGSPRDGALGAGRRVAGGMGRLTSRQARAPGAHGIITPGTIPGYGAMAGPDQGCR